MTRIALKRLGLTPVKDVAILQIGGNPERLSALEAGKVQATMLPQPDNFVAQKRGFYNIVSVRLALSEHRGGHDPEIHSGKS